jgi:hypothetical protein
MLAPMESHRMTLYRVELLVPTSELQMEPMLPKWVIVMLAIYVVIDSIVHPGKRHEPRRSPRQP